MRADDVDSWEVGEVDAEEGRVVVELFSANGDEKSIGLLAADASDLLDKVRRAIAKRDREQE